MVGEESRDANDNSQSTRGHEKRKGSSPDSISHHSAETHLIKEWHSDEEATGSPIDVRKVIFGVSRHAFLILLLTAMGAVGVAAWTYFLNRTYTTQAYLLFGDSGGADEQGSKQTLIDGYAINKLSLPTMLEMMKLPVHFKAAKSVLGTDLTVQELMKMATIGIPAGRSNLVSISVKGSDPTLAVDLANALANVIVKHSEDLNRKQLQEAFDYFTSQNEIAKQKSIQIDKEITDFKIQNPSFQQDVANSSVIEKAAKAKSAYQSALVSYNSMLVEYENLKREAGRVPEHTVKYAYEDSPLKDRISQTEMALLDARTRYAPENPKIKLLESSLKELRNMMSEQSLDDTQGKVYEKNPVKEQLNVELMRFQGKLRSAQKTKEDLEATLADAEKGLQSLPKEQVEFARLMEEKKNNGEITRDLAHALRVTQLLLSVGKGDIALYQSADVAEPLTAKWEKWLPFLPIFGGLFGFIVGILISLFLEVIDQRIWTPKQIDINYGVPCALIVPEIPHLEKKDIPDELLFYQRDLVDYIEHVGGDSSPQTIGFISSLNDEGKSCFSYQLAHYYATRLAKKTVFLAFDTHPNKFITLDPGVQPVENFLVDSASLKDIIQRGEPDIIRIGTSANMKELVKTERMHDLWKDLKHKYDIIVVDVPGVIEDDYGLNILSEVDRTLFVIGASVAKKSHIDSSLLEMERLGVIPSGILLNRVLPLYVTDVRVRAERKQAKRRRWKNPRTVKPANQKQFENTDQT